MESKTSKTGSAMPEYMTPKQLAGYLSCSVDTISAMIKTGLRFTSLTPGGRKLLIARDDVRAYLDRNAKEITST